MKSREGNSLQDDVKLKVLEREAKANRDQLETMLARFADSNTRQNLDLQPGFARIIQSAAPAATPFFPRKGPTVLLATLAGLGIGLGLAFLLEIMAQASRLNQNAGNPVQAPTRAQQTSRSADDTPIIIPKLDIPTSEPKTSVSVAAVKPPEKEIEKPVEKPAPAKLPVLASLPQVRSMSEAKSLLASLSENGSMSDTMRRLSNQVQAMHESGMLKACAMTSVGGALEGATTAIALSRSLALADIKTILIDLDGARGVIEDLMELPTAPGITDLLEGSADFSKAIQRDSQTELQVLRHGAATGAIAAQVPQRMEAITRTLTSIYEVVIIHIGEASPSMLFSARGCTTVLVNAPLSRKADALAAGATLKSKGFDQVFLIQVEDALKAAA
jgi:polysaccharide biosynthesis transport protein